MRVVYLIIGLISSVMCQADDEITDDILRSEIESAASESRALADELAEMLSRLEVEEVRKEAVEAVVVGDDKKVETVLKDMIEKIDALAIVSEYTEQENLKGSQKEKKEEEQELKSALEKLEVVAQNVKNATSKKDIETIDDMAELIKSVSDEIDNKFKSNDEVNRSKPKSGKGLDETALELNGIEEMISTLEKVTDGLKNLQNIGDEIFEYEETDDQSNKNASTVESASVGPVIRREENTLDNAKSRSGKSLELEDRPDENVAKEDRKTFYGSQTVSEMKDMEVKKDREPKELEEKEKSEENCTEREVSNRVQVCVPKFLTADAEVQLSSGEIREERHCYDV